MAEIVKANASLLRGAGFNKRRHCFNRVTLRGPRSRRELLAASEGTTGLDRSPRAQGAGDGTFRIDFGVYVPEMTRTHASGSSWVNEPTCDLRTTIGDLVYGNGQADWWWPLSDIQAEDIAASALLEHGLPWLDGFPDHEEVLGRFRTSGPFGIGMSPAGALDIAQMLSGLGRPTEARAVLEGYVEQPVHRHHAAYLAEYLPSIGHADLVPRVTVQDREH